MAGESLSMQFPNEKVSSGARGYAEALAKEEIPGFPCIIRLGCERLDGPGRNASLSSYRRHCLLPNFPKVGALLVE